MEFLTETISHKWKKLVDDMRKMPKVTQVKDLVTMSGVVEFR
jgi:hypothetical protein